MENLATRILLLQKQRLVAKVDARATAEAFIAAIHSIAIFQVISGTDPEAANKDQVRSFVRVFWHGLMPREQAERFTRTKGIKSSSRK